MTKFNLELKKKFIEMIESNNYSIGNASKELGISDSSGERWWKMYQIHGYKGLSMKTGKYSGEFKIHVVKYMYENHLSVSEASAMFGIPSHETLLKWESIYTLEGESGLMTEKRGRPRKIKKIELEDNFNDNEANEDIMLEVKRLRAEIAY